MLLQRLLQLPLIWSLPGRLPLRAAAGLLRVELLRPCVEPGARLRRWDGRR